MPSDTPRSGAAKSVEDTLPAYAHTSNSYPFDPEDTAVFWPHRIPRVTPAVERPSLAEERVKSKVALKWNANAWQRAFRRRGW